MTKKEYLDFHKSCCDKMVSITAAKNADYTGDNEDPFSNFSYVEKLGICSVEVGFLTRMTDKLSRIRALTKQDAQVKDESIQDTLIDLANYCVLLAGYLRNKKQEASLQESFNLSCKERPDYHAV